MSGSVRPTLENFFSMFLEGLGLPVTQDNLNALYGVAQLEGWNNRYNPLNVVQPEPDSYSINSVGVQGYDDFNDGVRASVALFSGSHWAGVRAALAQGNNAQNVLNAFKQAYTWDPGVQFPMGTPDQGGRLVGPHPGDGNIPHVQGAGASSNGGGGGGNDATLNYQGATDLGSLLSSVPELKEILQDAQQGNWSIQRFQNAIENSTWYKTHSETARQALIQEANDPATWAQRLKQTEGAISQLASNLGFSLTADQTQAIANTALLTGNDSNNQWLTDAIGKRQNFSTVNNISQLQGQEANTADSLAAMYESYGFHVKPELIAHQAKLIVEGYQTPDTYKNNAMQWAMSAFPALRQQLSDGTTTVADIASPYISSMSNLLEISPNDINVYTPLVRQALQGGQTKNGDHVMTPLWQFEQQVRNDPRWQYTDNAHQTMAQVLGQIGTDWGFTA